MMVAVTHDVDGGQSGAPGDSPPQVAPRLTRVGVHTFLVKPSMDGLPLVEPDPDVRNAPCTERTWRAFRVLKPVIDASHVAQASANCVYTGILSVGRELLTGSFFTPRLSRRPR